MFSIGQFNVEDSMVKFEFFDGSFSKVISSFSISSNSGVCVNMNFFEVDLGLWHNAVGDLNLSILVKNKAKVILHFRVRDFKVVSSILSTDKLIGDIIWIGDAQWTIECRTSNKVTIVT